MTRLRAAGADEVYCLSVNDAFVMFQWGKQLGLDKVKLAPDGSGDFTRRMGMLINKDHLGFGQRSWRYAMVVDDGVVSGLVRRAGNQRHRCGRRPVYREHARAMCWNG